MAQLIRVDDVALQPWRNGGGQTRELLAWPSTQACQLRIAVADIEHDGPFSTYAGVERWIAVISGVGIELSFRDGDRRLLRGDAPLRFNGDDAPACRLIDGPTRDLNLMVHGGLGVVRDVRNGIPWEKDFAMCGLFTTVAGRLRTGDETQTMPAMSLLWSGAGDTWVFDYDERESISSAWWLGFTPEHN